MRFITFEGIEGCGKSTQAKKLHEFFLANNQEAILTREPGGTKIAEKLREVLVGEDVEVPEAKTELLLNFTARLEHVEKLIKPSLALQKTVISDRFFDSTYAYQGSALGVDESLIDQVRQITIGDFEPDITFFIDVPLEVAFERIKNRKDNNRYEKLGLDFHQKVRDGFLKLAQKNSRIKIIDGLGSIDEIFNQITQQL